MSRWESALSFAVLRGVTPESFWRLSVREWRALSAHHAPPALARSDLDALMQTYPDR